MCPLKFTDYILADILKGVSNLIGRIERLLSRNKFPVSSTEIFCFLSQLEGVNSLPSLPSKEHHPK